MDIQRRGAAERRSMFDIMILVVESRAGMRLQIERLACSNNNNEYNAPPK